MPAHRRPWHLAAPTLRPDKYRQESARHCRTKAPARQGTPEIRRLTAVPGLWAPTLRSHHLRFAQPRAIGLKVSDEFTVPLCRGHHRQLHQAGNEAAWWQTSKINALAIARSLWEQSHADNYSVTKS